MKKKSLICLFLLVSLLLTVPVAAQEQENPVVTAGCYSLYAQSPLGGEQQKVDTAKAVILYELNTDTLLYAYNPDLPINPTGLVKLLTALVVIENADMAAEVTVKRSVLDTVAIGSVSAGLKAGEILTVRDLLLCVMVASANDASAVLANFVGGTQADFAQMLNRKAESLGCTASNFVNAHGLNAEGQISTARDLAIIAKAALDNPVFAEMFCAKSCQIPATNLSAERKFNTTNHMMSTAVIQTCLDPRVTGGKPAAATNTDRSMICTAEVGTSRYLCVVMGAAAEVSEDGLSITRWNIFEEVSFLLDFGFANYGVRQVIDERQSLFQYSVDGGANAVVLRPSQSVSVLLPLDFDPNLLQYTDSVEDSVLHLPVRIGDTLGMLQVRYESVYLGQCSLVAMNDVLADGTAMEDGERIEKPVVTKKTFPWGKVFMWVGIVLGALALLAVIVMIVIRMAGTMILRVEHRQRASARRRKRR